jgi:hypothetical protein
MVQMENDFTDEAGVALAETLTVNKTLRMFSLAVDCQRPWRPATRRDPLEPYLQELTAMHRVNTSLMEAFQTKPLARIKTS